VQMDGGKKSAATGGRGAAARRTERRKSIGGKPTAKTDNATQSKGSAKQRARGLERLLKRDLPDDVRRAKEAELAVLRSEGQKSKRVQREKAFSKKYHKVKFFERQKVERRIGQLQKQIAAARDKEALQAQLVEAQHDLLYVRHFPRNKKYLSLFPAEPLEEGGFVAKLQARIRARIIRRSEAGTLDQEADDDDDDEEGGGGGEHAGDLETDDFFAAGAAEEDEGGAALDAPGECEQSLSKPRKDRGSKKRRPNEVFAGAQKKPKGTK